MRCKYCRDTSFTDIGITYICDSCGAGHKKNYHATKHNRDVELTDLLTSLLDRYGDLMTPQDRNRIDELTKPLP